MTIHSPDTLLFLFGLPFPSPVKDIKDLSETYKELLKLSNKKMNNSMKKWAKDFDSLAKRKIDTR